MTTALTLTRTAILYLLGLAAMFLLFCEPAPDSRSWLLTFLLSKAGAAVLILIMRSIMRRKRIMHDKRFIQFNTGKF